MSEIEFPQIITFYSYKGGVGRSMALMNVAYTLASWGRHVLMIDMDLEAPGVSGFLQRSEELQPAGSGSKDILTLLAEVKRLSATGLAPEDLAKELPPVSHFIRAVKPEKLASLAPKMGQLGRLDLLGPDLGRNYEDRLAQLGLQGRGQEELVAMSRVLHFYLKGQRFLFQPEWLKEIEPAQPTSYDYVLVDSRTGITEIGGLCVGPLADRLVVVTGLNDQNVEGTRRFLEVTGIRRMAAEDSSPVAGEESSTATLGPKPTLIVASPVPIEELTYRNSRLGELERVLGTRPSRLSYHPQLALMETVFIRDHRDEYLALEYRSLTERILDAIGDTAQNLPTTFSSDLEPALRSRIIRLLVRFAPQNPQLVGSILPLFASTPRKVATDEEYADAIKANSLLALSKTFRPNALNNLGSVMSDRANNMTGEEAIRLFALASEKFEEAVRLEPDFAGAWSNWGNALKGQATGKTGDEADRLFTLASEKQQEAVRLKPDLAEAWSNWGAALFDQAKGKSGEESHALVGEARVVLAKAASINPGVGAYNAACLEAICNEAGEAIRWLRVAQENNSLPSVDHLAQDSDLDNIRQTPEFLAFLAGISNK